MTTDPTNASSNSTAAKTLERARAHAAKEAEETAAPPSPEPKEPLKARAKRGAAILAALIICCTIVFFGGSGTVNVAVLSESGAAEDAPVMVSLYRGDVTQALSDDDPSNDPEPIEAHQIPVGQRTSFNVKDFGAHTIGVSYLDDQASWAKPDPLIVNMIWFDLRETIQVP